MENKPQDTGDNLIDIKEEKEEQKVINNPSQKPKRNLRNAKHVDYSKFFSEDQDNSEDYETPEEIKQNNELGKKRKRTKSTKKENTDSNTVRKRRTKKEKNEIDKNKESNNNEENKDKNNMDVEAEKNKEKEEEKEDKKIKNNNVGTIINITETLQKYNNENIPNSEIILIILEICLNSSQFDIDKDNSSRAFWEEIGKKEELKPITSQFKPETLRKYWRTIRETKKFRKIITEIKKYRNEINNANMKLFAGIHAVCEYVSNPSRKMEFYINKHITKTANKSNKTNVNNMTPNEQIEEIINIFKKYFVNKDEKEILDKLFKNNFDIENTFLVLKDEENMENLGFNEKEDEIIKRNYEDKDDENEEYQNLLYTKGLEYILKRKEFLFSIKIDRSKYIKKDDDNDDNLMDVEIKEKDKEENKNDKEENKKKDKKKENGDKK